MAASETIGGGDEGVASSSNPSSPRNKVKFLCSYGGKILARPGDSNLKYVGGETRVVAVPWEIKFSELMKKLNSLVEGGDMVLKYQVIPEELDALVTVRSDEDLKHMLDEYHRHESEGTPKLRAFLFPVSPVMVENQMNSVDHHAMEQRYIEAVNGIVRTSTSGRITPINANHPNFSTSTCSSPSSASPDGKFTESSPLDPSNGYVPNRFPMPKVQSSPSLYNLGNLQTPTNNQQVYQPHYYYPQNHQQLQPYGIPSPRPPQDFRTQDFGWGPTVHGHGHGRTNHVYSVSRHNNFGHGCCRCGCYDECLAYPSARFIRGSSVPATERLDRANGSTHRNHIWE